MIRKALIRNVITSTAIVLAILMVTTTIVQAMEPSIVEQSEISVDESFADTQKTHFMNKAKQSAEEEYEKGQQEVIAERIMNEVPIVMAASSTIGQGGNSEETAATIAEVKANSDLQETIEKLEAMTDELKQITSDDNTSAVGTGPLVACNNPDKSYTGGIVSITGANRENLEGLVMGEAGGEGFIGAALVAQTIRDTMLESGITDVATIKRKYGYSASMSKTPNEDVIRAVSYIFDYGETAVQHKLKYYYAYRVTNSAFHESQQFVLEYGGHRFFCEWGD